MKTILGNTQKCRTKSALDIERIANKFFELTYDDMYEVFNQIEKKANIKIDVTFPSRSVTK